MIEEIGCRMREAGHVQYVAVVEVCGDRFDVLGSAHEYHVKVWKQG